MGLADLISESPQVSLWCLLCTYCVSDILTLPLLVWFPTADVHCPHLHLRKHRHYHWEDTSLESKEVSSHAAAPFQDFLAPGPQWA